MAGPEGEERKVGPEKIVKEIMAEDFPNLMKNTSTPKKFNELQVG